MLNIDPLLFQPKVIRMSTTSNIGHHIIRTTEYSNSQIMTGTAAHLHNEANNNILTMNNTVDTAGEFASRGRDFGNISGAKDLRNFNEMELSGGLDQEFVDGDLVAQHAEWTEEMYWSGEGDVSDNSTLDRIAHQNSESIMSFQSNLTNSTPSTSFHSQLSEQSDSKEEIIHSMLIKVRSQNKVEASKVLLAMSNSVENCIAMRQCGCIPLLIQLLHSPDENSNTYHMMHAKRVNFEIRERASQVLHNIVFSQPDDKKGRREARVLRLLEQIRDYCDQLRNLDAEVDDNRNSRCVDQHIGPTVAALMKLSFDEDHRHAMCQLGGLQAIAELLQVDHEVHGCTSDQYCITIRRYSGMALTNLTFGDGANKALLCSLRTFMEALVAQLYSPSEDLRQVTASVLRNLSWRADPTCKRILRDTGSVTILVKAAIDAEKESTLKSILSALWNLSAHCSANKADICLVDGALAFLVSTLTYKSKSKTLAIVENGGGILRNISSHIAIQNEYRAILRKHNCLQILLQHLKSPSLTVVSNACGTLWNLSARNAGDQRALWEMGAVGMLKKLINSKHKMISMGSSAALKNLLSAKPPGVALGLCVHNDGTKFGTETPSLHIRKEKALIQEIDQNLAETYDNTDSPKSSPSHHATNDKNNRKMRHISPSAARYLANQKKRNDLLSLQKQQRVSDEKLTYVVEEKHNGAFQVTKNPKPALSYLQGQNRVQTDLSHVTPDKNEIDRHEYAKGKKKADVQTHVIKQPTTIHQEPKFTSAIQPPQMSVKKDYKGTDRVTNVAQVSKTIYREVHEDFHDTASKNTQDQSGIPKPLHESRIPLPNLPKSCLLDAQRSQSASPVPQRRSVAPQRQDKSHNVNSRNVDVTVTHPKYAWISSNGEKEDNEPEQPVKFPKPKDPVVPESKVHSKHLKTFPPQISQVDDYGSEDEIKVYNTENTPMNYCLNEAMNDVEELGASARCSLNIRTCTNVKLMKNHPLLSNVSNNKADDNNAKLFEYRHASKDYRNFEGGKTVDFSVQSDYEIDENLSMISRSNSEGSLGSFDQQSFHDDDSFVSDLSRHTSGIASPSELSDSPCQTVPSSPEKPKCCNSVYTSNSSDTQEMKFAAVNAETERNQPLVENHGGRTLEINSRDVICGNTTELGAKQPDIQRSGLTIVEEKSTIEAPASNDVIKAANEIDLLVSKLADENYSSPKTPTEAANRVRGLECEKFKTFSDEQSISEVTESADFVTCVSEFPSSSSVESETMEDISPTERVLLEKCIRAGLPHSQGVKQKVPQLSYQLLKDTVEKHPNACSFDTERSTTSLKTLELKETEYDSHSENEEKGKEDERRAEKKRLFRIPESPVEKKTDGVLECEKHAASKEISTDSNDQPSLYTMKVVVDQKGNRRCEKHSDKTKPKQKASEPMPSQLDFLMTSKKNTYEVKSGSSVSDDFHTDLQQQKAKEQNESEHNDLNKANNEKNQTVRGVGEEFKCREIVQNHEEETYPVIKMKTIVEPNLSNKTTINDEEKFECNEIENGSDLEDSMISSSLLCEAREIAEALLGARIGSTEDMTVSTLSCLSDVDGARPPSVLADMGCLSMTNSIGSEENLKAAVTKECQKILGKTYNKQSSSTKKSLLRELQIGRLNNEHGSNDHSNGSNGSPESLSLKSNSTSDLLGNVNPPSVFDEMSLTASTGSLNGMEGIDSECDSEEINAPYPSKLDSMSLRMHNAAAMAHLYAKEFSNITGNCVNESPSNEALTHFQNQCGAQEVMEVTIADITEIGCDTIGSDTELDDDFPCDEDELNSETLQAPFQNSLCKDDRDEGSTENLTVTLTDEPPRSPCFDFTQNNGFFMTAEELKALQENADLILNTLRNVEISDDDDDEEHCCMSTGDMLEDETMSLVSNESDEEFLSPDGNSPSQKRSPKNGYELQVCNGMIALPQSTNNVPSKYALRKTVLPNKLAKDGDIESKNRIPYAGPEINLKQGQISSNTIQFSETSKKSDLPQKTNQINQTSVSKIRPPVSSRKSLDLPINGVCLNEVKEPFEQENSIFDSRTFTRKKSSVPKGNIPSIPSGLVLPSGSLRSPSQNIPSLPGRADCVVEKRSEPAKSITSKVSAAWKNEKVRSKSMVDRNRNSKFKFEKSLSFGYGSSKDGLYQTERSPSQSPSPQSPLSRSSTSDKLSEDDGTHTLSVTKRPSSLALSQRTNNSSPRHIKMPSVQQRAKNSSTPRKYGENASRARTVAPTRLDLQSPTLQQQNLSSIPKFQNKAQPSLIPNRRSMIPTPAKFDFSDN